jgi:hypothetical protein
MLDLDHQSCSFASEVTSSLHYAGVGEAPLFDSSPLRSAKAGTESRRYVLGDRRCCRIGRP